MTTDGAAVQENERISVMMDKELRETVEAMARKADRSFSAEVRQALREWVEKAEAAPA